MAIRAKPTTCDMKEMKGRMKRIGIWGRKEGEKGSEEEAICEGERWEALLAGKNSGRCRIPYLLDHELHTMQVGTQQGAGNAPYGKYLPR